MERKGGEPAPKPRKKGRLVAGTMAGLSFVTPVRAAEVHEAEAVIKAPIEAVAELLKNPKTTTNHNSPDRVLRPSQHPAEKSLLQESNLQPNLKLLKSPWMEHLSEAQAEQINNFESLDQEQKEALTLHIFAVRKLVAEGKPINPAATLAQWALEGGWKSLTGYADWGIKQGDWQGPTQVFENAAEYDPKVGHQVTEPGTFRSYDSLEEASQDYAAFVAKKFPLAASKYQDTEGYIEALQHQPYKKADGSTGYHQWATGHTADGHDYSDDLKQMVKSYDLVALVAIPDEEFTP